MRLVFCIDRRPMNACKIVIYGSSCATLPVLLLSYSKILKVLKIMGTFAKTFEIEYSFPFV